jgi:hypothetical protein
MIFFYLLIILIIILLFIPHDKKENFIAKSIKKNVLAKTDDLSKYIILNQ